MFRVHPIQLRRATEAPHIHFLTTTPDDPRAYIIASNIARRHMSKGQQAMAVAMVYPEPEKTTHGKKSKTKLLLETKTNFSGARLSQARTVRFRITLTMHYVHSKETPLMKYPVALAAILSTAALATAASFPQRVHYIDHDKVAAAF